MASFTRSGESVWKGSGADGKGHLTTQSGVVSNVPYGAKMRFGDEKGTNPEELLAIAHAGCFNMALAYGLTGSWQAAGRATHDSKGDHRVRWAWLLDHEDQPGAEGQGARHVVGGLQESRRGGQGRLPRLKALQGRRDRPRCRIGELGQRPSLPPADRRNRKVGAPRRGASSLSGNRLYLAAPRLRPRPPPFFAGAAPLFRPSPIRLARSERAFA